jgi:hypothetical protein
VKSPIAQPEKSRVAAITAKGHGRFLAIMVAIFGGFKAGFSGIAPKNLPGSPSDGLSRPDPANGIAERLSRSRGGGVAGPACRSGIYYPS